jgi:SAM-dependent methyltransferase
MSMADIVGRESYERLPPMDHAEFQTMLALDDQHWWYRGRRRVLRAVLDGVALPPEARLLDAGAGSGRTLDELARLGSVAGVELNPAGVEAARERGHHDVREAPVEELPHPDASFDLVTCLDVIEHTDDDVRSLRELSRVTRPGGVLVVTVPAYPRLWSRHDEVNGHRRRYTRRTLRRAAEAAGWRIERMTGFNAVYLLPAAAVRVTRRGGDDRKSELALTPPALNDLLELPLRAEAALIARGISLPAGLSLLAILRKADIQIGTKADARGAG